MDETQDQPTYQIEEYSISQTYSAAEPGLLALLFFWAMVLPFYAIRSAYRLIRHFFPAKPKPSKRARWERQLERATKRGDAWNVRDLTRKLALADLAPVPTEAPQGPAIYR